VRQTAAPHNVAALRRAVVRLEDPNDNRQCAEQRDGPRGIGMSTDTQKPGIKKRPPDRLKVYQHSDLFYWWVVWLYGYFCAFVTWVWGTYIIFADGRPVLFYTQAWLGVSFVGLSLFVLVFTNARARGVKSLIILLVLIIIGLVVQLTYGLENLFRFIPLLLVYMNLAFYMFFSTVLLIAWVSVFYIGDRLVYWEFAPGSISMKYRFSEGGENFATPHVETTRHSDDFIVHKVLGLTGTGDLDVRFGTPGGGQKHYFLKNVMRIATTEKEINRLVAGREHFD
jgi:hypothetical protein